MNKKQAKQMIGRGVCGVMLADEFDRFAGDVDRNTRQYLYEVLVEGERPSTIINNTGISKQALYAKIKKIRDRQLNEIMQIVREEQCPCDRCEKRNLCFHANLSCSVFSDFIKTGAYNPLQERAPGDWLYSRVFPGDFVSQQRRAV